MTINGIDIEVEYKPIKHIHLSVYPPYGRVHVSAPAQTSEAQLRMFILGKWIWLTEKIEETTSHNVQSPREYVSGEAHYYRGGLYRLRVDVDVRAQQGVHIEGDYLVITCRRRENAPTVLREWYRERLKELLPDIIARWAERLSVAMPQYDVLEMTNRWGSCNAQTRKLLFNLELAKKPVSCVEYIVAHECIHLIERNHTDRFFRLLETYLPSWERLKKELNEYPITI